ncbi:glucose/galactose MFS transporter [Sphingomonas crusticola]|uniref:glucose/galactose MFS transporter n=1 Tax=Sphingomonas crusticola TaxID=1697973 RepID=UPI000E26BB32|nr:glucose/galactose MFS transporter [Sphingomonas crusticola]
MDAVASTDLIAGRLFRLSIGVFFIGGFLSSVISLFVPRLTLLYGLDYSRALLVQFAFHTSYLLFAIPIAMTIMRIGYMRSAATGLSVMALSCGLFVASHGMHTYGLLLFSLLALSAGITFLQIAANTVVAVVGNAEGAAFRLNLLQAFNSVGTVAGPLVGAAFILGSPMLTGRAAMAEIAPPFLFAILLLGGLAIAFLARRNLLQPLVRTDAIGGRLDWPALLADRRLLAGTGAIFVYTGAEVAIGTLLVNYLVQPQVFGIAPVNAARLVSLYWGGAMIGRLAGAYAMRRVRPATLLMLAAIGAALLAIVAATVKGSLGGIALLAVGLCNSIMYPTIYVLALPDDPKLATPGGTLLCMAVVGGAVVPMLTGLLADRVGLTASLMLPAACYLGIAAFARQCRGARI